MTGAQSDRSERRGVGPQPWRLRAATAGGALAALGLSVLFNLGADGRNPDPALQTTSVVVSLAGLAIVIVSAARSTWFNGLIRAQAVGSVSVMLIGLLVLSFRDGEPFSALGALGLVIGPLVLALILAGAQHQAWQPGAERRMLREVDRLQGALDRTVDDVRGSLGSKPPSRPGRRRG